VESSIPLSVGLLAPELADLVLKRLKEFAKQAQLRLADTFKQFDKDRSGNISPDEFKMPPRKQRLRKSWKMTQKRRRR